MKTTTHTPERRTHSGMTTLLRPFMLPVLAVLLLSLAAPADADTPAPRRVTSIDFDTFTNGVPSGMEISTGATTGESGIENLIEQDTSIFLSGSSSLRITGGDSTTHWNSIIVSLPEDISRVTALLHVRGRGLQRELNQFDNCYAGFWYEGVLGSQSHTFTMLPRGTYDWTEVTVSLDLDAQLAGDATFTIFSSISGTLWVDELVFLYDDDCGSMEPEQVQGPLAPYIGRLSQPTSFMEVFPPSEEECPDSITREEALQDIEMLDYLFRNGYSGYDYWSAQGIDFDLICTDLTELAREEEKVSVADMERLIASGLSEVQDGHLGIQGHERHRFLRRTAPFFTDVIVERAAAGSGESPAAQYRVIRSGHEAVRPGMVYAGPEDRLFRILSRRDTEQYQLGVFTEEQVTEAAFQFLAETDPATESAPETVSVTLPLHENRLGNKEVQNEEVWYTTEIDGIEVVRVSSFSSTYHDQLMEFAEIGTKLAEKDMFIVDLTGNSGGNSNYAARFVENLNVRTQWRMHYAMLISPATIGAIAVMPVTEDMPEMYVQTIEMMREALERMRETPVRNWMYVTEELRERRMGEYGGRAVFLYDRGVASSGEAFLDYARSIPGAVLVGENSAGVGTFGEVRQYSLPNSLIRLNLPCKLFLTPESREGTGYIPDYWIDSATPLKEIAQWLNHPDSYQFDLAGAEE